MEASTQLKCACAGCGQVIEYAPAAAGQAVKCPKCGEKSLLPPPPAPAPAGSPAEPEFTPPKICLACGSSLPPRDSTCPTCAARAQGKRAKWFLLIAAPAAALVAVLAIAVVLRHHSRSAPAAADTNTGPQVIPQPEVHLPKSTNDLKVLNFILERRRPDGVSVIIGDVENISGNLHREVTLNIDLLDAHGAKVASVSDSITELPGHQTWHVIISTSNPKATGFRIAGFKEHSWDPAALSR